MDETARNIEYLSISIGTTVHIEITIGSEEVEYDIELNESTAALLERLRDRVMPGKGSSISFTSSISTHSSELIDRFGPKGNIGMNGDIGTACVDFNKGPKGDIGPCCGHHMSYTKEDTDPHQNSYRKGKKSNENGLNKRQRKKMRMQTYRG